MNRAQTCLAVSSLVLFHAAFVHSQTAGNALPTFTTSTELVLIPTVVNDKSGAHIAGVRQEEFVVKQDGKTQAVAVFEEVHTSSERVRRSSGVHGTFNNFEPGGSQYHRLTIIVLDFVNTPPADQANARAALVKFLSEVAESGEPMCLLALTHSGLSMLHDFTDDPKLLAQSLSKARVDATPMIHDSVEDPHHPPGGGLAAVLTALIRGQLESESQMASLEGKAAASITVQALQQIAKGFGGLPGRKSLIWASSGFPFSLSPASALMCEPACPVHGREEMQGAYENLWKLMNDAQIAIYSVDLRSNPSSFNLSTGGMRPSDIGDPQFDIDAQAEATTHDTDTTLQLFAGNTGGKAFMGGGNLVQSFHQAIQDDSSYYMLGYYVNRSHTKPGWHPITVTISRKGAHARYRNGFLFATDQSTASAKQDISLALISPLDFAGLPVSVTWMGSEPGKAAGKTKVQFDLVMAANFASVDESDQNHMVVDIAAVAKDPDGKVAAELSQRIDTHLKSDGLEQIQHHGMTYHNGLQLSPGEYTVHFVVRDALSHRIGSVAAPVKVDR
jgi:VWFA-related protein